MQLRDDKRKVMGVKAYPNLTRKIASTSLLHHILKSNSANGVPDLVIGVKVVRVDVLAKGCLEHHGLLTKHGDLASYSRD
jgi:hypothetical protein